MIKMAAVVVLGVLFLTNGFGGFAAPTVWADSGQVSVILNGKLLETDPHSAYNKGSTVMIPLREASNALKYTTTYQKSSETITLTKINEIIKWKLNEHLVSINNAQELVFKDDFEFRQDHIYVPISFFKTIGLLTSYDGESNQVEVYTPEVTASVIAGLLVGGKYNELSERYHYDVVVNKPSSNGLLEDWKQITVKAGNYHGIKSTKSSYNEDQFSIRCVLDFAEIEIPLEIILNTSGKIIELRETL
ncbi:copper amine oxidase N-terminal domain-containing protein [Paenibacillus sp. FSL L8-0493]|uniref:copper amine oxidase N-terminal domain-containing protein n=1 Tax=unclassified Paenibacillus TaxID=185978 RepID=UPI0030F6A801